MKMMTLQLLETTIQNHESYDTHPSSADAAPPLPLSRLSSSTARVSDAFEWPKTFGFYKLFLMNKTTENPI